MTTIANRRLLPASLPDTRKRLFNDLSAPTRSGLAAAAAVGNVVGTAGDISDALAAVQGMSAPLRSSLRVAVFPLMSEVSGGEVTAIRDIMGATFEQTGSDGPTLSDGVLNFASPDVMSTNAYADYEPGTGLSMSVVITPSTSASSNESIFTQYSGSTVSMRIEREGTTNFGLVIVTRGLGTQELASAVALDADETHILVATMNVATGTPTVALWLAGPTGVAGKIATSDALITNLNPYNPSGVSALGGTTSSSQFYNGAIGMAFAGNRAWTDAEVAEVVALHQSWIAGL